MKITYTKAVKIYLNELFKTLYDKEYFGFEETAVNYVVTLILEMKATIHLKYRRKAPLHFSRYGKDLWYVSYPKNKRTTWYFFFTQYSGDIYVIRYKTNNHVSGHLLQE